MLQFYPNRAWVEDARGRISFYENGRDIGIRTAYACDSLIGIRLYVPRALGCAAARLRLVRDGEDEPLFFPWPTTSSLPRPAASMWAL